MRLKDLTKGQLDQYKRILVYDKLAAKRYLIMLKDYNAVKPVNTASDKLLNKYKTLILKTLKANKDTWLTTRQITQLVGMCWGSVIKVLDVLEKEKLILCKRQHELNTRSPKNFGNRVKYYKLIQK